MGHHRRAEQALRAHPIDLLSVIKQSTLQKKEGRLFPTLQIAYSGVISPWLHTFSTGGYFLQLSCSRKAPSLAVALNWGIGSSSLNAEVKAFVRLQIVRGWNSGYCGSKYSS